MACSSRNVAEDVGPDLLREHRVGVEVVRVELDGKAEGRVFAGIQEAVVDQSI